MSSRNAPLAPDDRPPRRCPLRSAGGTTPTDLIFHVGGGEIPLIGRFNQRLWAQYLGCSEEVFRKEIRDLEIPFRRRGDDVYVDAADYWKGLPEG